MQKDFEIWNVYKKYIDARNEDKIYHEREVWWCSLGINVGFEEDGKGIHGERPVLVIRRLNKNVCVIVPLTTSKKESLYNIFLGKVGNKESSVITSQIRLIDTRRFANRMGIIDSITFETIRKAIKDLL